MSELIFQIRSIRKTYKDRKVNKLITFPSMQIERGKITVIKGETGIGKTTLLNMLGLMDQMIFTNDDEIFFYPQKGETILYSNLFVKKRKMIEKIRRKYFGFMFQHDHLIDSWTGWQNVILPYIIRYPRQSLDKPIAQVKKIINECHFVDMLKILNRSPSTYSGGQRQRTALLRALIHHPDVIFVDEPFASVPLKRAEEILNVLKEQTYKGVTTVMVAHDIHDQLFNDANLNKFNLIEENKKEFTKITVKEG